MARSRNVRTAGNVVQRVGRALSGGSTTTRKGAPRTRASRTTTRTPRRRTPKTGKGLLRRLLG